MNEINLFSCNATCRCNCNRPKIEKGVFVIKISARGSARGILFTIAISLVVGLGTTMVADTVAAEMQTMKHEGYLADVLCVTKGTALDGADMVKHPEKHSVACLKESPCVASGFGTMLKGKDENYTFQKFDKKGNELARELINKTQKKNQVLVEVIGQMKDGVINVDSLVEK